MKTWGGSYPSWQRRLRLAMIATYNTAVCLFLVVFLARVFTDSHADDQSLHLLWLCVLASALSLVLSVLTDAFSSTPDS